MTDTTPTNDPADTTPSNPPAETTPVTQPAETAPVAQPPGPQTPDAPPTPVPPGTAMRPVQPPGQHPYRRPPVVPRRPSLLERRWPAPVGGAQPAVLGAVVAAAAIGAVSIPLDRPGVGWLVSVLAGTGALAATVRGAVRSGTTGAPDRTGTAARSRLSAERLLWTVATIGLIGVGTVRAAGWLFVLCVLTAGVTAGLAVTDGRSVRGLLLSGVIVPAAVGRAVPWSVAGVGRGGGRVVGRTAITIAVSVALLVVFGALFASADPAFAHLLDAVVPTLSGAGLARGAFLFPIIGAGLLAAAFLLAAPPDLTGLETAASRRVRRLEWAAPVALLDALFAAFVLVQVTHLFGGSDHVLATSGLTYAEYARGGFWQLLAVSVLTVLVIAAASRWAPRQVRADRVLIRLLLGALALLSLVVVASALFRMDVYQQAYGFTRLRLLVSATELWLGLLFVLVLIAGIRLRAPWLPRLVIGTGVLALMGLAALNPDRLIADRNIDRYFSTQRVDVWYLSQLSADAIPALDRLPESLRHCAVTEIDRDLARHRDGWREANVARAQARRLLAANPLPDAEPDCYVSGSRG
ncbi:DUF4173 domain-containing protein [Micromonospora sp. NPDC049679]|uniref:DUF4153 domain-containing protein n=1 Tax=Micromonospora sp. NPDC049679 TaxID=3155920 RepID=UPI0033F004AD